ncbi:MAG: polysaccharide biosynthesis/export family protein [Bryobacteraceae bacterium]
MNTSRFRGKPLLRGMVKGILIGSYLAVCLSLAASAAQNATSPTPNTAPGQNPSPISAEASPQRSAGAPVDSGSFKVGASDVLNIRVWHEQEFSGPVSVHPDGKITLPLVGDLAVGGMTPSQIEQVTAQALTKYVVKPLVTVTVQEVLSKKYYLDGQVARSGEYPLVAPTTVLEALSRAGGLRDFANEKKIYILRGDSRIPFNYKEVIHGKRMEQNIQLEPGDHVIVP